MPTVLIPRMVLLAVLFASPAAFAQPAPDSGAVAPRPVLTLPVVRVEAAIERARRAAPTAFVTTLRADDGTRATASLGEVLSEAAGVRITQYGGMGAFSAMSLRGAPPGQVTVLLDGVPLTSAAQSVVDLSAVPATEVEVVEVYRGAAPAALGVPTPGGAVNLVTRTGATTRSVRAARGSFGTGEAQGAWGGRRGAWSLLAHGGWQGSDGDFRYRDDNGTPLEPADDAWVERGNARFDAASGSLRASWEPSDTLHAAFVLEGFRRGQGVPGVGSVPSLHARYASDRVRTSGELRFAPLAEQALGTLRVHRVRSSSRLRDTEGELGYGRVDTDERFADDGGSLEIGSPRRSGAFAWNGGVAVRREVARPAAPTLGLADPPASRRDSEGAWIGATVRLADERLLLRAERRWDRQSEQVNDRLSTGVLRVREAERTLDAPRLGARVLAGWGVEARANWSRSARAPEFDELFGNSGFVVGNPLLVPERAESWDAGLAWRVAAPGVRVEVEWSHHLTHARDLVLYERSSPRGARPVNVGRARLEGDEATLGATWRELTLRAHAAWLAAVDQSDIFFYRGRRLPQRAEFQSGARLTWRRGPWLAALDLEHSGDTFLDRANRKPSAARTLAGASLGRRVGRFELLAEGRNLGDVHTEDVAGFPLPGRLLLLSITGDLTGGSPRP